MDRYIELLFSLGFNFHPKKTKETLVKTYVLNYNGIRHWVRLFDEGMHNVKQPSLRLTSFKEGTEDETPVFDTGLLTKPSIKFVTNQIEKAKELMD